MAFERKLAAVPPQAFTANGTAQGLATIDSTAGFYIKQFVNLQSDTHQSAGFQVKNILSRTQLIIGPADNSLKAPLKPLDLSAYTVADGAIISAPEQDNFTIKPDDHYLSVYLPAPVSADRVIPVDPFGAPYGPTNPMPVAIDGDIEIGIVEVKGLSGNLLDPNTDGSIKTVQLFDLPYDSITATYPLSTREIYQSRVGGETGTVQQTVTVNYTDASKNFILNVVRT